MLYSEDVGDTTVADDALLPDWFCLESETIYDKLNPRSKAGTIELWSWRKRVVDCSGKPITSISIVANCLLKILVTRKLISNTPMNWKLQTKNEQQEQRLEFTCIGEGSNAMVHECHLLLHGLENNYVSISILWRLNLPLLDDVICLSGN